MENIHTVLLVEDEPDLRFVIKIALEEMEHVVVKNCASGKEALRMAEEVNPQLILLDYMLPDMDGLEVLKNLRENPKTSAIPVIITTAYPQKIMEQYKDSKALHVITKPFDPSALSATISRILAMDK